MKKNKIHRFNNMASFPKDIKNLIQSISQLPGIGPKTAERFVLFLLKRQNFRKILAKDILNLKNINFCENCGNFTKDKICNICADPKRNKNKIIVLAQPQEINVFENIHDYNGLYHVLGGLINSTKDIKDKDLDINGLIKKIKKNNKKTEIIFALNSTSKGEGTMLYIKNLILKNKNLKNKVKLSRIARGIPTGGEISYADDLTLRESLTNRRSI